MSESTYFSTKYPLSGIANIPNSIFLQQTEIDGSCQTKVSVPVNTELRFQSSTMWHNCVLTKCQLDNQSKKHESLETSKGK